MPDTYWYPVLYAVAALMMPVILLLLPFGDGGRVTALVSAEVKALSRLNRIVGSVVGWLALYMVVAQFVVVVLRYVYGFNSIGLQESVLYAHGILFTLAAGYTLLADGHVRVDIFYSNLSPRMKALVDLIGTLLFLIPFMLTILYFSWTYVANAWSIHEGSRESSGLPYMYALKTVLLIFPALLLAQGIALAGQSALTLTGHTTEGAQNEPN